MNPIASSIPGRMRIRHPALRDPVASRIVREELSALPGVQGVEINPRVGSVLLAYDATRLGEAEILASLDVFKPNGGVARPAAPAALGPKVVEASLAASLGLTVWGALAGLRGLHVTAGVLFLSAVGAHLLLGRAEPARSG